MFNKLSCLLFNIWITSFLPLLEIRNQCPGYAVSIVKAGAKIIGRDAGPVRAPLTDLNNDEMDKLAALIDKLEA